MPPVIKPITGFIESHKQLSLNPDLTVNQIQSVLTGVKPRPSSDGKCDYQWDFTADGIEGAIWDFRGSRWSAYGPSEMFHRLGLL